MKMLSLLYLCFVQADAGVELAEDQNRTNDSPVLMRPAKRLAWLLIAILFNLSAAPLQAGIYRSDVATKMSRAEFDARMAELDRTMEDCTRTIRANSSDANAYYRRAVARRARAILLFDNPGYGDTIEDLEKCVQLAPDNADAQFELGNVYMLQSKPQLAVPHYDAAIKIAPSAKFYRARSTANEQSRLCYAAIHDLDKVIEAEPNCAECYYHQPALSDGPCDRQRQRQIQKGGGA